MNHMSSHNEILTYIIEHLGLPLIASVPAAQSSKTASDGDAEAMAKILTLSVDLGMSVSAKMNVPTDAAKAEALRFKLTALGAHALSRRMQLMGKEPLEADIDSLKASIDSLLVFAQNFALDDAGVAYLEKAEMKDLVSKEVPELLSVEALLPVISVIDHKDRGIFENVAARLVKEAEALAKSFQEKASINEEVSRLVKHKILTLLCQIFVDIYPAIIRNQQPLGDVWQEFDRKKMLVLVLMDYFVSGQNTVDAGEEPIAADETGSEEGAPAPAAAETKAEPPPVKEPVKQQDAPPPEEQSEKQAPPPSKPPKEPAIFGKRPEAKPEAVSEKPPEKAPEPPPQSAPAKTSPAADNVVKPAIFGAPKKEDAPPPAPSESKTNDAEAAPAADETVSSSSSMVVEEESNAGKTKKRAMPPPPPMSPEEQAKIAELQEKRARDKDAAEAAAKDAARRGPPPTLPVTPSRTAPPQSVPDDLLTEDERRAAAQAAEETAPKKTPEEPQGNPANPLSFFTKKDED